MTRRFPSLLTGFPGTGLPAFDRYYESATTPHVHSGGLLRSPVGTSPAVGRFAPRGRRHTPPTRPGACLYRAPQPGSSGGDHGASHVPEDPWCTFALLSDPGHRWRLAVLRSHRVVPAITTTKTRSDRTIFGAPSQGFGTRCLRFTPASRLTVQDSLPAGGQPYRMGFSPTGFQIGGFSACAVPLLRASRGATQSISGI